MNEESKEVNDILIDKINQKLVKADYITLLDVLIVLQEIDVSDEELRRPPYKPPKTLEEAKEQIRQMMQEHHKEMEVLSKM